MSEVWLPVVGYEEFFEVSNLGRVRSKDRIVVDKNGRCIKIKGREKHLTLSNGYCLVGLNKHNRRKAEFVHRLVAKAFFGCSDLSVNHKNGIKTDNRTDNLEWCTLAENTRHQWQTGLVNPIGCFKGRLSFEQAEEVRKLYKEGLKQKEIAKLFCISRPLVSCIVNNKIWRATE